MHPNPTTPAPAGDPLVPVLEILGRELLPLAEAICYYAGRVARSTQGLGNRSQPEVDLPGHRPLTPLPAGARELFKYSRELLQRVRRPTRHPRSPLRRDADRPEPDIHHFFGSPLNRVSISCQLLQQIWQRELFDRRSHDLDRVLELVAAVSRTVQERGQGKRPGPAPAVPALREEEDGIPTARLPSPTDTGRIVVVDDEAESRQLLGQALVGLGYKVSLAQDGLEAQALLLKVPVDVILLDFLMPGMNGLELLHWIRSQSCLRSVGVLMLTSLAEMEAMVRCVRAGADDYLLKPVQLPLLDAKIDALLQRRRLRARELEQFFPPHIARRLLDDPGALQQAREPDVSLLFCDIRGFSAVSHRLGPSATMEWIREVMEALSCRVLDNGGVLVDFIGDEMIAMWGASDPGQAPETDHAPRACNAALEMLEALPKVNERLARRGIEVDTRVGIGIHSGKARVGNTGTSRRLKYGPLGSAVNLASRLQGATKYLKSRLILSRATQELLQGQLPTRRLATIRVVGIEDPLDVFEAARESDRDWADYQLALEDYEKQNLQSAARRLGSLLQRQDGTAGPPLFLMARTMEALLDPSRWSRLYELPGK